jgi:hypothetical protein
VTQSSDKKGDALLVCGEHASLLPRWFAASGRLSGIWRLIYGAFDLNIGFVMFAKPIILGREDAGVAAGSCRAARTPTFHVLGL